MIFNNENVYLIIFTLGLDKSGVKYVEMANIKHSETTPRAIYFMITNCQGEKNIGSTVNQTSFKKEIKSAMP